MRREGMWFGFVALLCRYLNAFHVVPVKTVRACRGLVHYIQDTLQAKKMGGMAIDGFSKGVPFPCLTDRYEQSGTAKGAYFYQDILVAQKVFEKNPERHLDVGSSVSGFVGHVASYRTIEVLDVRPLTTSAANIEFRQLDLMSDLEEAYVECCDSLSCLHALEHFGLGRYGDPICPEGHRKGWENLYRMLKSGGTLYFSVPLGRARIEFNAHRVFSPVQLREMIRGKYDVVDFMYIDDQGDAHCNQSLADPEADASFGCSFGCAVLELIKK